MALKSDELLLQLPYLFVSLRMWPHIWHKPDASLLNEVVNVFSGGLLGLIEENGWGQENLGIQ